MEVKNVCFAYENGLDILKNISFKVKKGAITTLMGGNGCGKTTLLRLMTKNLNPISGQISLNGKNIQECSYKEFAKNVSIVHQKNTAPGDLTIRKLVSYGRVPHKSLFLSGTSEGDEKVRWAMEATGISSLANRPLGTLSGGQRQRAFIAMALAQDTKFLFLDEPTTFLDVRYQIEILRLIKRLNKELDITIVTVLHDINQALAYSDEVIGLKDGEICMKGPPRKVITQDTIQNIYSIELKVFEYEGRVCVIEK